MNWKPPLIRAWLTARRQLLQTIYPAPRPRPENVQRILLARFDRLGDLVLTTSIFPALRRLYPGAEITIVVSPGLAPLLLSHPDIDHVLSPVDTSRKSRLKLARRLAGRPVDLALDLTLTRDIKTAEFLHTAAARFIIGFASYQRDFIYDLPLPDPGFDRHFVDTLHDLARAVGANEQMGEPAVYLTPAELADQSEWLTGKNLPPQYVLCHPGAYYESQRYPLDRLILALDTLARRGLPIIVAGGPSDLEILDQLAGGLQSDETLRRQIQFMLTGSLRELVRLIHGAKVFLGNNSGPLHLAAACNVPTVSTLGPTRPAYFSPCGKIQRVFRLGLDCSPCDRAVCDHHSCLRNIPLHDLVAACEEMFSDGGSAPKTPAQGT